MWFYLLWVPFILINYVIYAKFSLLANETKEWKWVFYMMGIQAFAIWPIIARYSKNILFDGLLYDFLIIIVYYAVLVALGAGENFGPAQWVGSIIAILGLLVMKIF